jgi:8-oxo-dGTP diphosphatase
MMNQTAKPPIHVAAGVMMRNGEFLICQRRVGDAYGLKWEFPGGKLHHGETPETALVRELGEELGIDAGVGRQLWTETYTYADDKTFRITFLSVPSWQG